MKTEIKVLAQDRNLNYDVLIRCIRSGVNRNKWDYRNIRQHAKTFAGTPILCAYVGNQIGGGHNFREVMTKGGEITYDFTGATAERIVGAISENPEDIRVETNEEGEWVVAKGKLWRFYNQQLVDHIAEAGVMEVSSETMVVEGRQEGDVEVYEDWYALGVTILNEKVAPAVPGANIKALQEIESEFKELKLRAAAFEDKNNSDDDDLGEPDEPDEPDDDQNEPDDDPNEPDDDLNEPDDEEYEDPDGAVDETANEPQAKTTERNDKALNIFRKKQLAELAPRFEGYTVLSAGQDDNGIHVCLMSAAGETAVYTMASLEDLVDPKKISKVDAQVTFNGNDWEQSVELDALVDDLTAKVVAANNELKETKNALQTAQQTVSDMTEKEMKRRVSAAKAKAQSTLDAFNANREDKVDAKVLNKIEECIDNGDFSECENAEGEWCGEEEVANQVLAACAKEVMELDKKAVLAKNSQFIWDGVNKANKPADGDVESLLAEYGID